MHDTCRVAGGLRAKSHTIEAGIRMPRSMQTAITATATAAAASAPAPATPAALSCTTGKPDNVYRGEGP